MKLQTEAYVSFTSIIQIMKPTIEMNSLSVNRLRKSVDDFLKYEIELALDEVENSDLGIKLKFKFILLSNPTNIKIIAEGLASLAGEESEMVKQLEPDQRNIPIVVNTIYQEIFPLLYMLSTSLQIPCPAYKLSHISSTSKVENIQNELQPTQDQLQVTQESDSSDVLEDGIEKVEIPV